MRGKIITEEVCKMANFIVMGTWDTKREELEFILEGNQKKGVTTLLNWTYRQRKSRGRGIPSSVIPFLKPRND